MIIMNLKIDNYLLFKDFEINMSYPKKIVNSGIAEWIEDRPNFRYKKIVILMGANATGKTALGKIIMMICNFMDRKSYNFITDYIEDKKKKAFFEMDFVLDDNYLYRIKTIVTPMRDGLYESNNIKTWVAREEIKKMDSYELCSSRIKLKENERNNYVLELEKIPKVYWMFESAFVPNDNHTLRTLNREDYNKYCNYLESVLTILDPRISSVKKIPESKNAFVIKRMNDEIIIKDGKLTEPDKLSSGTLDGIGIANILTIMKVRRCDFYYCDEKFSHVHSEIEKSFLSMFVDLLDSRQQMFFTTHNSKILDIGLPLHSFVFMKRDKYDNTVSCICASDYIKKNDVSLKNAVENDVFSTEPNASIIFDIFDPRG